MQSHKDKELLVSGVSFDFSQLNDFFKALADTKLVKQTIRWGRSDLQMRLRRVSPKDTGRYAKAWRVKIVGNAIQATNKYEDIINFLENGTKPHIIRVKYAKALHWKDEDGRDHFAQQVMHPGTKAQPHIQEAVNRTANGMLRYFFGRFNRN